MGRNEQIPEGGPEVMPEETKPEAKPLVAGEPVRKDHEITLRGKKIAYETVTGFLALGDKPEDPDALVFFIAYLRKGVDPAKRKLTFAFNGGPGSPSIWLHLGALGPYRVPMRDGGAMPKPPYSLEANDDSWFPETDLVFIDPVGTGYSHAKNEETAETFWGMKKDIDSMSEFIRLFLGKYQRFSSPLFLAGESYGTTRSAGIADNLTKQGIGLSGIVLVSSVLNFQTLRHYEANDLPYLLFLPTFAATAWYHGKIDKKKHPNLRNFLKQVEDFCHTEYAAALFSIHPLSDSTQKSLAKKIAEYSGLTLEYVLSTNLRVNIHRFCKELRRTEGMTVGRLDSRITGFDIDPLLVTPEHDPSMSALMQPYVMTFSQYVRTDLGHISDQKYQIFGGIKKPWKWDMPEEGPADTSNCLKQAMVRNPYLQVFIASGLFDLATPYFATEYTLSKLHLNKDLMTNFTVKEYEAGHMMYVHEPSLTQLRKDVEGFMQSCLR